jgi:hypothetical protein
MTTWIEVFSLIMPNLLREFSFLGSVQFEVWYLKHFRIIMHLCLMIISYKWNKLFCMKTGILSECYVPKVCVQWCMVYCWWGRYPLSRTDVPVISFVQKLKILGVDWSYVCHCNVCLRNIFLNVFVWCPL